MFGHTAPLIVTLTGALSKTAVLSCFDVMDALCCIRTVRVDFFRYRHDGIKAQGPLGFDIEKKMY